MHFATRHLLPFVVFMMFAAAMLRALPREHSEWKRTGVLHISIGGFDFRRAWIVYAWLAWGGMLGITSIVVAFEYLFLGKAS